jgi:acetyl-CoA carboxylase carboxyltransferase component
MSGAAIATKPSNGSRPVTQEREASVDVPRERVEMLCDPGSFMPLRSGVLTESGGAAGDGVLAGAGSLAGHPVYCYAQDPRLKGGSLGGSHAESIVRVMRLAGDAGAPIVGFVESGGARLQEGHDALAGYGRIFKTSVELSRLVPQVSIVAGVSAGGGAYSPALTDFVVMCEDARMFLTGPQIVREALGEDVGMAELGGPSVHSGNGVCQLVAPDVPGAVAVTRELLSFLPGRIGAVPEIYPVEEPGDGDPAALVPDDPRRVYDIRDVVETLADGGRLLELDKGWGRSMVTGFARFEGRSVGIIANQPRRLGGVIDAEAAEKGALFVDRCDRFGIPLVVLVDTPGFMPGTRQEGAGVIRYGAQLLRAFAAASVPKITVVLRKAYGGAVITMNSRGLGADMVFAWPGAEIGIMAARQAVGIVERRTIAAADEPEQARDALAEVYAGEHLTATTAAASGFVDEVIEPHETRRRVAWALGALEGRR